MEVMVFYALTMYALFSIGIGLLPRSTGGTGQQDAPRMHLQEVWSMASEQKTTTIQHDYSTYRKMLALIIAERKLAKDLPQTFRLCIPEKYLLQLGHQFQNEYKYEILGTCFEDESDKHVLWMPVRKTEVGT